VWMATVVIDDFGSLTENCEMQCFRYEVYRLSAYFFVFFDTYNVILEVFWYLGIRCVICLHMTA
jgi:hypothetical protein